MTDRMIRLPEVTKITSLSSAQLYRMMEEGTFPKQYRISHRVAAWKESEVAAWVNALVAV